MNLSAEFKAEIDAMTYDQLLAVWRFAAVGDPRMQGESGTYWGERMALLRERGADTVAASKSVGWE